MAFQRHEKHERHRLLVGLTETLTSPIYGREDDPDEQPTPLTSIEQSGYTII